MIVTIGVELEPGENAEEIPEGVVVRVMQDGLARAANSPAKLLKLWQAAKAKARGDGPGPIRQRHRHVRGTRS